MKNLKLSWELSSNLQLQSENEIIRCTALDIEQNRLFFASADLLYTLHLPSSQNEESRSSVLRVEGADLDASECITAMEYLMEKESLIIGTSTGGLLQYNVDIGSMEVVGRVEGGVKSISPSPDGDLLCIISGIGQMLVMTHDWDLLYETPLEDQIEDIAADARDQCLNAGCTPGSPATWRGDGKFFATISAIPNSSHKKIKVWERDTGNLHSVSEPKTFAGDMVEWMPSGAKIAAVCDKNITFFEKNGLERSTFTVIEGIDATIDNLKWNCSSDLLAAIVRTKAYDSIKICFFSNNHWYLKQEIRYSKQDGVRFMWDPVKPLTLISWTLVGSIKVHNFIWISSVTDSSVALVVDGSKILVTPLSLTVIPPPMYLFQLRFPCSVRETAFWSKNSKNMLAASLTDGSLSVVELAGLDTWQDLEGEVFSVELCVTEDLTSFFHLTWTDSHILLGVTLEPSDDKTEISKYYIQELELVCSEDRIPGSITGSGFEAKTVNKLLTESTVIGLTSNPVKNWSTFVQLNDGKIFEYGTDSFLHERNDLRFSSSCPWMIAGLIEDLTCMDSDPFLLFGLDNNGKLHVNQNVLCNNCSSFSLYSNSPNQTITHLVIATKQDSLFVVEISDIVLGQTEVKYGNFVPAVITRKNAEEGKKFIQIWEKGSKILGVVHGDESVVIIQTSRGNLESIYPRKLLLESIMNALVQGRFRDSLLMVRRHRIDFNIIVDYMGWQEFVKLAAEFVKQVDNLSYITEFVCSLKNENVMEMLYKSYISYTNEEKGQESTVLGGQSKVNSVLRAVRKALEEQIPESQGRELCILTTLARSDPPCLEEALERVKVIREMELSGCDDMERKRVPSSEESLKHLLWLSETEAVFEAALGLYDLNLAAIVALNSQQDPKEFLPFLQELEVLPILIMRYKIDLKLRRFEKALQHIVAAGDLYLEDCINLIKSNPQLFSLALQLITDPAKKKHVLEAWGDHLINIKSFEDAATTYLCCNNLQKALKSYWSSNNWGGVLTVAGLMKLQKEEIMQMAYELCEELQTIGKPSEAAKIAFDYCNDIKNGISLLISAREWEEALRIGLMHGVEDLISDVKTGAVECGNVLIAEYEEGLEKVGKYLARYLAVRQRRLLLAAKLRADERSVNELDDDAVSEASSSFSGMSAYTTGTRKGSTASMSSSGMSKRGVRRQKKRGTIRAGSPDEEAALVEHIKGMGLTAGAKRELKSLLTCLVMIGKEEVARKLQRVGENFQLSQISAVKLAEDAISCDIVDEHAFVLEAYMKKLRQELLHSEEFFWESKVFVAP